MWRSDVVGVCGHAAANHLAVNFGAPGTGVLEIFEDDGPGAFAQHETVACGVEWPGGPRRIVVPRRQRLQRIESTDAALHHRCFGSTGHNGICLAKANGVEGVDERMRGACTSRHRGVVGSPQVVPNADVSRRDVGDHHRDEEWGETGSAVAGVEVPGFVHEGLEPSNS